MSAARSATQHAEHLAVALSLADALQAGFAAQRAGHQRRVSRPLPTTRVTA
jgi:hypothetical protein